MFPNFFQTLQTIFMMVIQENHGQKLWILSRLSESPDVPAGCGVWPNTTDDNIKYCIIMQSAAQAIKFSLNLFFKFVK